VPARSVTASSFEHRRTFSQLEGLDFTLSDRIETYREKLQVFSNGPCPCTSDQQQLQGSSSLRKSTYDDPAVVALPYTSSFLASIPWERETDHTEIRRVTAAMEQRVFEIRQRKVSAQADWTAWRGSSTHLATRTAPLSGKDDSVS